MEKGQSLKTSIVLTTINVPRVLEKYIANAEKYLYSHSDVEFIVIGDRKEPTETRPYIESLGGSYEITYMGVSEQESWLRRFPQLGKFIPWNSVERRNFGYLIAAEHRAEVIISIDDDNAPLPYYDFIGSHSIVGQEISCEEVESSSGWFNLGNTMTTNPPGTFYVRGFPVSQRWKENKDTFKEKFSRIAVNAGLWMGDPDVDTLTRIAFPCQVTESQTRQLTLARGTWSPFNSQNTAFHRSLLPCMYLVTFREGSEILAGNNSFRFDDIWMSYFCKRLMDSMGDKVCFGVPYVHQKRNPHDYILDLKREIPAIAMNESLIRCLQEMPICSTNYADGYDEIIENLSSCAFPALESEWVGEMLEGMRIWSRTTRGL